VNNRQLEQVICWDYEIIFSMKHATVKSFMKKIALIQLQGKLESLGWLELELSKGSAQARKMWGGRLHKGSKDVST
jgi:hypothetical protein